MGVLASREHRATVPDAFGTNGGTAIHSSSRRRKVQGAKGDARPHPAQGGTIALVEQSFDQLDGETRRVLETRGVGTARVPLVDRTWVFDTISHFEVQDILLYPVPGAPAGAPSAVGL